MIGVCLGCGTRYDTPDEFGKHSISCPTDTEACVARIRAKAKPVEESRDWHAMGHRLSPNKPMPCPRCPITPPT